MVLGVGVLTARGSSKTAKNSIKLLSLNILISCSAYLVLLSIEVCFDQRGKICASLKNDKQLMVKDLKLNKSQILIHRNLSR